MIQDIEDYFTQGCGRCPRFATLDCATRIWADGLAQLRALCVGAGLTETVKWGHPCYTQARRNVAIIGAHRAEFRLSFLDAALMKDPEGVLEKDGPNTAHPGTMRFRHADEVAAKAQIITGYLAEALGYAEAGGKPVKTTPALDLPETLVTALDDDPELAEAFARLTPGRQRSYVIHLGSAKTEATQNNRIAKARDKIIAGKGAMER